MCLCCRDEALWCAGDPFEACCFKCQCSLSPCCQNCCTWCKCWTCCIKCCYKWCPCCCWPPRQCMAWFLGLIGFFFMLSTLLATDWVYYPSGAGPMAPVRVKGAEGPIVEASWGLYEGCVRTKGDEDWSCSPTVVEGGEPVKELAYNDIIAEKFGWFFTVGFLITVGEVLLVVALIVVFVGLCCPFKWRFTLFRAGMYLYLLTDIFFMIALIVFPAKLSVMAPERPLTNAIGWCYGMGWGVVVIVFTGALLLLLDKDPSKESKDEPVSA